LLAARGWRCVLLARGRERLEAVAEEIEGEAEVCDVADRAAVEEVAARVGERHPAIRLLVNNAGIPSRGRFLELDPDHIEAVSRTNYLGGVWCTRAFLPLLEAGAPAHVVNVVSVAGLVAHGSAGPYSASKHAQLVFSRGVATELAPRGIRTLTVSPGPVETPGFPQPRLRERRVARRSVLEPEEVAAAILRALDRDRKEIVVPSYLRLASLLHAVAPGTLSRLAARLRSTR
jgi:uncharacterized protein